jgi:hypothetical protein
MPLLISLFRYCASLITRCTCVIISVSGIWFRSLLQDADVGCDAVQVAEWIGRRLTRPHSHRFLGTTSDVPLCKPAQTKEAVDVFDPDGDPGDGTVEKYGLLLGPTTAQLSASVHAQHMLWQLADRAVSVAQEQELQAQERAKMENTRLQEKEQAAAVASAADYDDAAVSEAAVVAGTRPSHGSRPLLQ